jgi:bacteriorhodopsin
MIKDPMYDAVYKSAMASLVIQILIGAVTGSSFLLEVENKKDRDELNVIIGLEFGSQIVEFIWYTTVLCRFNEITTWTRYIDWVVSTPIMLCSTSLFFTHRDDTTDFVYPFVSTPLYMSLGFNWIMLLFGFLVETEHIPRSVGLALGSCAFVASFTLIATYVHEDDVLSVALFWFTYAVWACYGVAAAFPYREKNIAYNMLDIVSKNFYGVFLFGYTITNL